MSPRRLLATLLLLASSLALLRHDAAAASRIIAAADLNGESMLDPSVIGNTRQVVRLDALKRQVIVEEIQPAAFTATDSNATEATQQLDTWLPYNLLVTSSPASAIVTGSVWSSPSPSKPSAVSASSSSSSSATARGATDATDWNTSRPIGMVAVATGQAIRMYTPAPANPFTTNTSSSAVKPPRELLAQPLLIGQGGIVALLYEIQSELCVCGMQTVVPPRPVASNSSLTTLLYVWDGEGNLNLMRLQQGRVSGGSLLSWTVSSETRLARPETDRTGRAWTPTPRGQCGACTEGADVMQLDATSSGSSPSSGGLYFSPRSSHVVTSLHDSNGDGKLDYFVVRSSTQETRMTFPADGLTEANLQSVLGVDLMFYRGSGEGGSEKMSLLRAPVSNGVEQGQMSVARRMMESAAQRTTVSSADDEGVSAEMLLASLSAKQSKLRSRTTAPAQTQQQQQVHHDAPQLSTNQSSIAPPAIADRPDFFPVSSSKAAASSSPSSLVVLPQVLRLPSSIAHGFFSSTAGGGGRSDGSMIEDLVIGVTEYLSGSSILAQVRGSPAQRNVTGVSVRRRLITLRGLDSTSSSSSAGWKFDPSTGSMSDVLAGSEVLWPGVSFHSAATTTAGNATFAPLLSAAVSLTMESDSSQYSPVNSTTTMLSDSVLRLFDTTPPATAAYTRSITSLGFPLFPFTLHSLPSPFFSPTSLRLLPREFHHLLLVRHDAGAEQGRMEVRSRDAKGRWSGGGRDDTLASAEFEQSLSFTSDATLSGDLSSLLPGVTHRSFLVTTPHPAVVTSHARAKVHGGRVKDVACAGVFIDSSSSSSSSGGGGAQSSSFKIDSASQIFYSTLTPPVSSPLLLATSVSSPDYLALPRYRLLAHEVEALEWSSSGTGAGGYQDGWRREHAGIVLEKGSKERRNEWDRIILSPITWVLLFLCLLLAFFGGWIYFRQHREARRIAAMQQSSNSSGGDGSGGGQQYSGGVDGEVERVLNQAPAEWRRFHGGGRQVSGATADGLPPLSEATSSPPAASSTLPDHDASSPSRTEQRPPSRLRAPPNSAQVGVEVEMATPGGVNGGGGAVMSNANVGFGVLLHQLAPETASHTVTPQRVDSNTSLRMSSHADASPPVAQPTSTSSGCGSSPATSPPAAPGDSILSHDLSPSLVRIASVADVRSMHSSPSPRGDRSPSCDPPHTASSHGHGADEVFSPSTIVDVAEEEHESKEQVEANELQVGCRLDELEEDPFRR